jgi:hypothetical protein
VLENDKSYNLVQETGIFFFFPPISDSSSGLEDLNMNAVKRHRSGVYSAGDHKSQAAQNVSVTRTLDYHPKRVIKLPMCSQESRLLG